ncbi:MAG: amidohydrolase family protein, partial [Gammaproteobacteria bacterium]|nr:amidohydrolase family protein [Gammaproteobacteria bacterium]
LLTYVRQQNGENQLRMLLLSDPVISKPISQGEHVFPYPARWLDRSLFLYASDGLIRRRKFGERHVETIGFNARIEIAPYDLDPRPLVLDAAANQPVFGSNGRAVDAAGRTIIATLGDLWELRPDGTLLRQLTNDPFVDASPVLSPDNRMLAFVSDRRGSLQVWLKDLESMQERQLTREPGVALEPRWTDDGDAIEYLAAPHAAATETRRRRIGIESGDAEDADLPEAAPSPSNPAAAPPSEAPGIPLTWKPLAGAGRTVIRAGRIFDGIGPGYAERQEIIVDNDRITAIRPWRDADMNDANVRYIDASDQTVMPGLIDASVQPLRLGDERLGRKFLAYGVTTIREHVVDAATTLERYESWTSGRRIGPRLLMASTVCSDAGDRFVVRPVLEPAVAQRAFRAQINAAAERGSVAIGMCPALNVAARVDLIANVHARGLPAITTRAFPELLLGANESRSPPPGQAGYDDFALVTGALETTVTTNLAPLGLPLLISDEELITGWQFGQLFTVAEQAWYGRSWHLTDESLARHRIATAAVARSIGAALANGARVVTGSDAPQVPPGLSMHAELRLLTRSGLQPFQALRMATADAARALGAADRLGVIRPGAIADLVIVAGDPLDDIREAANITTVIAAGRPYSRRDLSSPGNRPASVGNLYNSAGNASSN